MKVNFYKHTLNTKELRKIDNVFKSNILSTGKFCKLFRQLFQKNLKISTALLLAVGQWHRTHF